MALTLNQPSRDDGLKAVEEMVVVNGVRHRPADVKAEAKPTPPPEDPPEDEEVEEEDEKARKPKNKARRSRNK